MKKHKTHLKKVSEVAEGTVKGTISIAKEVGIYISIIIAIPILSFLLDLVLLIFISLANVDGGLSIAISIIVVIQAFILIIKIGFNRFSEETYLNRIFAIIFGFTAYWSLLFQLAIIFALYYGVSHSSILPMDQIKSEWMNLERGVNPDLLFWIRLILNDVFPNFFKYPTAQGIAVTFQFFLGKFIDLFILAFIVERLKKKI